MFVASERMQQPQKLYILNNPHENSVRKRSGNWLAREKHTSAASTVFGILSAIRAARFTRSVLFSII